MEEVLKAMDLRKSSGPDLIDHYFLKLAADFIAEPLAYILYLTVKHMEIPRIWKSAFVLPLLKRVTQLF